MMNDAQNYLTTFDAAKVLQVSPATVRLWNRLGKLPAIRTEGGMRLFTREDVARLATERRLARTADDNEGRKNEAQ
jgi:excisionase family DNA binding protein